MSAPPTPRSSRAARRIGSSALVVALVAFGSVVVVAPSAQAAPSARAARTPPPVPAAGSIDAVTGGGGVVRVTGWALNPTNTAGLGAFISVDTTWNLVGAGQLRADAWRAYPRSGPFHGYDATLAASPGRHFVCVIVGGGGTAARMLGCRFVDVGYAPYGSIDAATITSAERVRVTGWTADPDTSSPIAFRVTVDGAARVTGQANLPRPDVAANRPGTGPAHGLEATVAASVGTHTVCVEGIDAGGMTPTAVACRSVTIPAYQPRGNLETVSIEGNTVVASGWADDPDGNGPSTVTAGVSFGGFADPTSTSATADASRPDVGAFLGIPAQRGFRVVVPIDVAGPAVVCIAARNQNFGTDQLLGCKPLGIADHRPQGGVDRVDPVAGGLSVSGWYADPDDGASVTVRVVVDGVPHPVVANQSRPDVGAAYPAYGANRGFGATVGGLANGIHEVCVVASDIGGGAAGLGGDRPEPCGTVVVGSLAAATRGMAAAGTAVGPTGSNPLAGIDRDGGVSVSLRDGSTLWLFADSMAKNADGSLRYFVNNTAAWAPPGNPAATADATAGGGPVQFAAPGGSFPACSDSSFTKALWPMSAVAVPAGGSDRVVVYMANMCLKAGADPIYEPHGVSIAQYVYDPAAAHAGQPIQATMLAQQLFSDVDIAEAAVLADDGYVYVYRCDGPANGGWPTEYGPCTVGRVLPADVATASDYRWWNGSSWVAGSGSAMTMPNGRDGVTNLPVGGVNVVHDAVNDLYVMGYSPWPGFTNQMVIRIARSPQGPWTAPIVVQLPGCDDAVGGEDLHCYAASVQPRFSQPGQLGIGWYDQAVAANPTRGSYVASTLQLSIVS